MHNFVDFGICKAMQDQASMLASAAVCCSCLLFMQLCDQELLEQQLPYFPAEGGSSTAAGDMAGLLATTRQHWRALRRQHKRVWGESQGRIESTQT